MHDACAGVSQQHACGQLYEVSCHSMQNHQVARMHPTPGFYLDLGANSALDLSNTHALDALGWRGVCVVSLLVCGHHEPA